MRRIGSAGALFAVWAGMTFGPAQTQAAENQPVDRVFGREGRTWVMQGGVTNRLETEFVFAAQITVMTNATFKVNTGKARTFKEGQVLLADGLLLNKDGSVGPAADHAVLKNGRAVVVRDGEASPVQDRLALGDGSSVTADGYRLKPGGASTRLLDGQILGLDGRSMPAKDTVLFVGGSVRGQKDGALYEVPPGRSLMMNDGTKVFGDGALVTRSGAKRQLAEGEVLLIDGVVRKD
jgi:hypothetical protein